MLKVFRVDGEIFKYKKGICHITDALISCCFPVNCAFTAAIAPENGKSRR